MSKLWLNSISPATYKMLHIDMHATCINYINSYHHDVIFDAFATDSQIKISYGTKTAETNNPTINQYTVTTTSITCYQR